MDRLLEQVQSGDFDPVKEFAGNEDNFLEVKTAMESISNNLPKDVCMRFILTKIAPTVFDKNADSTVRNGAVEIGLHFLQFANVSILGPKQQEDVFGSIEGYAKVVGELRDNNYERWDKLWIFLIKLCSEKLHTKMSIANKILRVVEVAFRNSTSIEHRLKAYDCWVELINNSSLNMDYMCSAKQIKLLVTPLKAKFSRMPVVIMKRCDTFVYLLEKLQHKATLCVREFLEFCFGPFDEKSDVEKMRQARGVPEVCDKSTAVLLEILGHSDEANLEAYLVNKDLNLYKPLIDNVNFPIFFEILINSVVQCCYSLNEWSQDLLINNTIIKCLWRSLLLFIHNSNDGIKLRCCTQINNSLRRLLEKSQSNKCLHVVLAEIINVLIQDDLIEKLREVTFDVLINLLHHIDRSCTLNLEDVKKFVVSCFDPENGSKFDKIASNSFKKNAKCENPILCYVWLKCHIILVPENISIFIWPVRHVKEFKDIEALKSKWTKLYTSECKNESVKIVIMQEIEKIFLANPLLSSNIVLFLEVISSGETNPTREFVAKFMRLIELVLTLPNLSIKDVQKITSIVLTYCNQTQHFYKLDNNDEALDKLCGCLEHLLTIHKDYTILPQLFSHLQSSQPKNLAKFSKRLMTLMETLMLNEDFPIANNSRKLIELLETKENEPESVAFANRSMRLISMANSTSKSKKSTSNLTHSRFSSPLPLKASTPAPGKDRMDNKKKKHSMALLGHDNSSDYVKIDTEVTINVENLNEHQKEMFKKRREDIPALYQDLTQSQSQDFFNSIVDKEENEKKRKRTDDDGDVQIGKICKISDQLTLESRNDVEENREKNTAEIDTETQISDSIDPDLTEIEIFGDGVEPVQREPPEELFEETPPKIFEKAKEEMLRVSENTATEANKEDETLTESDKTTTTEEAIDVEGGGEENEAKRTNENSERQNDVVVATEQAERRISPRAARKPRPCTPVRKSSRNVARRMRGELFSPSVKQQESTTDHETDQSTIQDGGQDDETVGENAEKNGEDQVNAEDENTESMNEMLRKSKRYVNRRSKASTPVPSLQSSQDYFETPPAGGSVAVDASVKNRRKQGKEQIQRLDDDDVENLSFEDLLTRVDKRIEDKKRLEKGRLSESLNKASLQDDNENKIISLSDTETEDDLKQKETKGRIIKKAKRQLSNKTNNVAEKGTMILAAVNKIQNDGRPPDIYEFRGEEEPSAQSDGAKKPKRKKKGVAFSRSDYSSKRRKRVRKENREEAFPFHVTADSSLPLSKSPSLRAVTPSSETITIVITRSPPDTSPSSESHEIDTSPMTPTRKRNRSKTSPSSEDVIESSQTPANTSKRTNSPKSRRSLKQTTIEESMKPLIRTPERRRTRNSIQNKDNAVVTETADRQEADEAVIRPLKVSRTRRLSLNESESQMVARAKRVQRSRSLDKLDFTAELVDFASEIIDFSMPKRSPVEGEAEPVSVNDTSADTLTYDPSTSDENRETNEPEADTLSLSPVKSLTTKADVPTSPITCDTPDRIRELLNSTSDISPINTTPEPSTPVPKAGNEVSNVRVARLLQMVNANVPVSSEGSRWFGNKYASPGGSRVKKMRMRKEENLDILTFSREVPSPLTVPASSILKRKFNLDETATPSPKRKRVNFSDPAITDKKIFIKDSQEYEDNQKTDSTNESPPLEHDDDLTENEKVSSVFDREEALSSFRDFCDSNFKDINDNEVKSTLRCLLQDLRVPEVLSVVCECFSNVDAAAIDEIKTKLTDQGSPQRIIDELIVPVVRSFIDFEEFLPTLLKLAERLPDDKLETFISEVTKTRIVEEAGKCDGAEAVAGITERDIEDFVVSLDSDKMNDLIKKYFSKLQSEERNNFLIDLMSLASNELPANKQFVNCHVNILQNFVKRMHD